MSVEQYINYRDSFDIEVEPIGTTKPVPFNWRTKVTVQKTLPRSPAAPFDHDTSPESCS